MEDLSVFEEFRFGVKSRTYNWPMRVARERLGFRQKDLGARVGLNAGMVGQLETFRWFPKKDKSVLDRISQVLEVSLEVLFPDWLEEFRLTETPKSVEEQAIGLDEAISLGLLPSSQLMLPGPEEEAEKVVLKEEIRKILPTLTDREARVLELRFGLDGNGTRTLEEIGQEFGVNRERIRQIEAKALRKMRHPSHTRRLRDFLV